MEKPIKVAMVCHFSNPMVRSHLPLDNRVLYKTARKLLGMPIKRGGYGDIAAWDTYLIEFLSKRRDVELFVISAHSGLKKSVVSFIEGGVNYYFVKCDYATLLKRLIKSPSLWLKLNPMRPKVKNIINKIHPDIVTMVGAENAHIASTVIGIDNYPVLIQCQTIYNNPARTEYSTIDEKNAFVERELFKTAKYVAIPSQMHYDLFKKMNSKAFVFDWKAKTPLPKVEYNGPKEYDFVNYALTMDFRKGYHDSIRALAVVKERYPNVTLNLTGGSTTEQKEELISLVKKLNLQDNVVFTPFFEKQEDLFRHIQKSRFALLPSKIDSIAGTMVQAMHFGLPLVCYETVGTPKLNKEKECALIAEMNNVEQLAEKMLLLLDHPDKAEMLKKNALERLEKRNNMDACTERLVNTYKAIVDYDNEGIPIPNHLFFNPNAVYEKENNND